LNHFHVWSTWNWMHFQIHHWNWLKLHLEFNSLMYLHSLIQEWLLFRFGQNDLFVFERACHEFEQWQRLRAMSVNVGFKRILHVSATIFFRADSEFASISLLNEGHRILTKSCHSLSDGLTIVVQSIDFHECWEMKTICSICMS
jgi:hypothetical protein